MTLLRLWLVATAVLLAAVLVWAFAPVLLFLLLLTGGLGLLSALMIGVARATRGLARAAHTRFVGWVERQRRPNTRRLARIVLGLPPAFAG